MHYSAVNAKSICTVMSERSVNMCWECMTTFLSLYDGSHTTYSTYYHITELMYFDRTCMRIHTSVTAKHEKLTYIYIYIYWFCWENWNWRSTWHYDCHEIEVPLAYYPKLICIPKIQSDTVNLVFVCSMSSNVVA